MKLFTVIIKYASIIGIRKPRPDQTIYFNTRSVIVLLYLALFSFSAAALLLFEAQTFQEYSEGFFGLTSASFTYVGLLEKVFTSAIIFNFIEKLELTIEERKFTES